jgi:hypothetical protein
MPIVNATEAYIKCYISLENKFNYIYQQSSTNPLVCSSVTREKSRLMAGKQICKLFFNIYSHSLFLLLQRYHTVVSLGGVRLCPLGMSATVGLLYQPLMIDDDDYGAVDGMRIGRGNRSTRKKPAPVPRCPPQIPHALTWDQTRATTVESQRLTA